MSNPIDNYNKIVTTVNSVTSDYSFEADANNLIVIDTSNNRIGINTVYPERSIHISGSDVSSGIITPYLQIDGNLDLSGYIHNTNDISYNVNISGNFVPTSDNKYSLGDNTKGWSDLYIKDGGIYLKNEKIIYFDENNILTINSNQIQTSNSLTVGGTFSSSQNVNTNNNIGGGKIYNTTIGTDTIFGDFPSSGYFTVFNATLNSTFQQDLTVKQDLIIENDISVNQKLKVGADVSLNSKLFVEGDVSINSNLFVANDVSLNSKLFVEGDASFNNTVKIAGQLHGPSSFIIDPATIGDISGKVQIKGDLEVLGNQTIIHSNIVDICDNRIRLNALDDINSGIDISINNTTKSFIYESNENTWKIDDASLNVNGNLIVNQDLSVNGHIDANDASFNNAVKIGGHLTIGGDVILPSTTPIGNVTSTELSFLSGVTSAIQYQLRKPVLMVHTNSEETTYAIKKIDTWGDPSLNTYPLGYGWNSTTYTYTVPKSGIYKVTGHFAYAWNGSEWADLTSWLYKDGAEWINVNIKLVDRNVSTSTNNSTWEYYSQTGSGIAECIGGVTTFSMYRGGGGNSYGAALISYDTCFMIECIEVTG